MRFRISRFLTSIFISVNIATVYYLWLLYAEYHKVKQNDIEKNLIYKINTNELNDIDEDKIQNNVTVIIRAFEYFENDIANTVRSIVSSYPNITVIILSDVYPYPLLPFNLSNSLFQNVRILNLASSLTNSFESRTPLFHIKHNFVLSVPDSTRIQTKQTVKEMVKSVINGNTIAANSFKAAKPPNCLKLHINTKEWEARYENSKLSNCDFIKGKHALLFRKELLKELTDPFMLPFPDSLYIQAAAKGKKVELLYDFPFANGKELHNNPKFESKMENLVTERTSNMYKSLGLKRIIKEDGVIEWFGCRRDTPRCFGIIYDDVPEYLFEGKWTPPCCLAGLRRTARHVFQQLEQSQVRYWLDGNSLLGAIRSGDILPWDYTVEIGIYKDDIHLCSWLLQSITKSVIDDEGYLWEKTSDYDIYRVYFSQINHLYINIFSYYAKNNSMSKNISKTNKRERDNQFPEHFLKPISNIDFVGRSVPAPNNIHDFLESKFGAGNFENLIHPKFDNFEDYKRIFKHNYDNPG